MSATITFPSTTPVFELPLLFAGQAQKEFTLNQALSLIDLGLQHTVTASLSTSPSDPEPGSCYRIVDSAAGDWTGREDMIAMRIGDAWHYLEPFAGMRVFDQQAGVLVHYDSAWKTAAAPAPASGGTVIDAEARQMIFELIEELRKIGVFPNLG